MRRNTVSSRRWKQTRRLLPALLLAAAGSLSLTAQSGKAADAKCKPGSKSAGCKNGSISSAPQDGNDTKSPSSTADFAFPVEDSKHGADAEGTSPAPQAVRPSGGLPAMPTDPVPDPPASSQKPMNLPPGYAGSSSSDDPSTATGSSSSRSAEDDDVAPTSAAPDAPVKSSALKDLGSRADTSEARAKLEQTRVADDLKVGGFYMKDGNIQGAYLRFKDAADHAPDDPDVRFNLAEAAGRLNKRDEAVLNYREYLKLDTGGDHDKASRKALGRLGVAAQ